MDAIGLRTEVWCIVGILPRERIEPQPLIVETTLRLDLERCAATGDLSASVDYGAVDEQIRFLAVHGHFRLLESMARTILRLVASPPVVEGTVTIRKPAVLRSSEPSVSLTRGPDDGRSVIADLPEVRVSRGRGAAPAGALATGDGWLRVERRE